MAWSVDSARAPCGSSRTRTGTWGGRWPWPAARRGDGGVRTALACDERMGARPDVALGRLEIARLLARSAGDRQSRPSQLRSALEQVRRAAEECQDLDMPGHLARADATAAELARAIAQQDPLSPRERESSTSSSKG